MQTSVDNQAAMPAGAFHTTHWSLVLRATHSDAREGDAALEILCRKYWPPLYAYVRRCGRTPHDAQDITQEFFARLLAKDYLKLAEPGRGKFRSFLLKSLNHFLINDWERARAQKRGGGRVTLSLDIANESAESGYQDNAAPTPEILYDRQWAVTLLERAMNRLRSMYHESDRQALFDALRPSLLADEAPERVRQIGEALDMSDAALKVALHRLRRRFREIVREEIAQTVASPEEIDDELRWLIESLSK